MKKIVSILISLACGSVLTAQTYTPFSSLPAATSAATNDGLALYQWNGSGYTAKRISASQLGNSSIFPSVGLNPSVNAVQELKAAGVLSNLVDFAAFTSFDLMTNTYSGNQIFFTNILGYTSKGAWCSNSSSITFAQNLPATNTIIINWWEDYNNANGVYGFLFQSVNTTTTNGEGFSYWGNTPASGGAGQEYIWGFESATLYPVSDSSFTNLVEGALGNLGNTFTLNNLQRHTTAISADGQGHLTVYEDGCKMAYFANFPNSLSFALYPTNSMNLMVLGNFFNSCGVRAAFVNGLNGYIESVFTFNTVLNTNLYEATVFASDWLQPHTARRIFVSDSWGSTPYPGASLPVVLNNISGEEELPINQNLGGTFLMNFNSATNIINFFPPHGKVSTVNIEEMGGVNDIYQTANNGIQLYNELISIFAPYFGVPGYYVDAWDIRQTSTNSSIYPQTAAAWSNSLVFDAMVFTNRNLFHHVYQTSALISQEMLNTARTPQLSTDGLHFNNAANGGAAILMEAGLVLNPYGVDPFMLPGEIQALFPGPIPLVLPHTVVDTFGNTTGTSFNMASSPNITSMALNGIYNSGASASPIPAINASSGSYGSGNAYVNGTIIGTSPSFAPTTNIVWWAFTNSGPNTAYSAAAHGNAVTAPYNGSTSSNFYASWYQVATNSNTIFGLSNTSAGVIAIDVGFHGELIAPLQQ